MNRIFLGGTCGKSHWRDDLIKQLKNYEVEWFNPVVKNWTPECQANEENEKNNKCNVHLYVITPDMKGIYSIAEIINSCWQAAVYGTTVEYVGVYFYGEWNTALTKSIEATLRLCRYIAGIKFDGHIINDNQNFSGINSIIGGLERLGVLENKNLN